MLHNSMVRDGKRRALEEFYGGEVPESTVERVIVLDADDLVTSHRFVAERMAAKTNKTAACWLWTGASNGHGYGRLKVDGRSLGAHRVAYELE